MDLKMEDNDDLSAADIEMLNSNDLSPPKFSAFNNADSNSNMYSPAGSKDSLEDSFIIDSDSKTPGEILDEFCMKLEDINTTLPDSVINHYMKKAGFIVNDPKLVKIVSIASQKFISEIVNDVMQHHKLKTKSAAIVPSAAPNQPAGAKPKVGSTTAVPGSSQSNPNNLAASQGGASQSGATASDNRDKRDTNAPLTLTLEDLSQVLTEYGINVKKPYYFM